MPNCCRNNRSSEKSFNIQCLISKSGWLDGAAQGYARPELTGSLIMLGADLRHFWAGLRQ